jgi:hypothetical protein
LKLFPVQLALVKQHLNEGVQAPLIKHYSIQVLVPFSMLFHDHLSLTYISNHNGSLNQFVGYQMTRLVRRVGPFVALLL